MQTLELALLFIAYSILLIAIFLQVLCYRRKLEYRETIAFTFSLLTLIVALTISPLLSAGTAGEEPHVFTLLAMTAVGLTTPLNVLTERQVLISPLFRKLLYGTAILLAAAVLAAHFSGSLRVVQYPVIGFLGISVAASMLLIRNSKPQKWIVHRERAERIFAILFLMVVPASLAVNYVFEDQMQALKIGFTVPLVFILLGLSKCWDDLQRLSLFQNLPAGSEHSGNHPLLTERENEIASLLSKGKTYKEISDLLFISVPTVKTHTSSIYRKLEVKNKTELTLLMISELPSKIPSHTKV